MYYEDIETETKRHLSLYKTYKLGITFLVMPAGNADNWINNPKTTRILLVFSTPKTPSQAERELCLRKLKLKPFLERHLLKCLNAGARKGRFYILSDSARKCLNSPETSDYPNDWEIIGWIISSPKQRLVVLRCVDERKLTSEEIRMRATQFNGNLSRPSTKNILRELTQRQLIGYELLERIKFYWITSYGQRIKDELAIIAPISPLFSSS